MLKKESKIRIAIGVFTYKQEDTIRQTLDGILCQKGDFDLHVVIAEDCSPDNTYAVCQEYVARYPNQVTLLPNTYNLGITGNFVRMMKACEGDYVGYIAGDDYWCDEHKLQKQLEYFRSHPDVGVVSTAGYKLLVKSNQLISNEVLPLHPIEDGNIKRFYFSPDYQGGLYAMPLSLLYKYELMQYMDFDEFIKRGFPVEDFPFQAILSQHAKWGHIHDLCVVYRVYQESATFISFDHPKYMYYHKGLAEVRRYLNELFPDDVCVTEKQLQEEIFYKEFLMYLHQKKYRTAKQLITEASEEIMYSDKVQQAKRFTKTWLHFIMAHYIKEYKYRNDIKLRT